MNELVDECPCIKDKDLVWKLDIESLRRSQLEIHGQDA